MSQPNYQQLTSQDDRSSTILHRLPSPVLTLILQCLQPTHKLNQLSHISRSLPPLTPAAFIYDCISTTNKLRAAWHSSPRLQQLLSAASAVLFLDDEVVQRPESAHQHEIGWCDDDYDQPGPVVRRSTPLTPSPHSFPLAQQMALLVAAAHKERVMRALFDVAGTTSLTRLHSLQVAVDFDTDDGDVLPVQRAFVEPLLSLPSLHTLRLSGYGSAVIDWTAFRLLLSLPLTSLDLSSWHVHVPGGAVQHSDGGAGDDILVTDTWRILKLPIFRATRLTRVALMNVMLHNYMGGEMDSTRRGALDRLVAPGAKTRDELVSLARLSTLQSLAVWPQQPVINLEPLYSTSLTHPTTVSPHSSSAASSSSISPSHPPLPLLRHLSVINRVHDRVDRLTEAEIMNSVQQHVRLVSCYSGTLVCLELEDILIHDSCRPILQAVCSCSELRRCSLETTSRAHGGQGYAYDAIPAAAESSPLMLPTVPQLHTLTLVLPLSPNELAAALSACPAVEDLRLDVSIRDQPDVMSAMQQLGLVGRACPRVKRLELNSGCPMAETETAMEDASTATTPITAASPSTSNTTPGPIISADSVTVPLSSSSSSINASSSLSSSSTNSTPPFSQLICLRFNAYSVRFDQAKWSSAALRSLTDMLHAARLQYVMMWHVPLHHLHQLSALSYLRGMHLFSESRELSLPDEFDQYFSSTDCSRHTHPFPSSDEVQRAILGEDGSVADEQVDRELVEAVQCGTVPHDFAAVTFVTARIFPHSANGREAFFDAVRAEQRRRDG